MTFDVTRVRAAYPALSDGHAYLDGAAGTQAPLPVIEAIADAYHVPVTLSFTRRVTYLIGPDGTIANVWPNVKPVGHAHEILGALPPR